jgi:hypothetical protein
MNITCERNLRNEIVEGDDRAGDIKRGISDVIEVILEAILGLAPVHFDSLFLIFRFP